MFGRIDGIENGLQRSGPLLSSSRWQFEAPETADAGRNRGADSCRFTLDLDAGVGLGHPCSGDRELRIAVHPSRTLGIDPVGRIEVLDLARERDREPDGSNDSIREAPLFPAIRFVQKVSASFPSGVSAPTPVITTRRRPLSLATPSPTSDSEAAVDLEHDPGHVPRLLRAQEAYRTGDVLRITEASERRRQYRLLELVWERDVSSVAM